MAKTIELRVYQCLWCDELWKNDYGIRYHLAKVHPDHTYDERVLTLRTLTVQAIEESLNIDIIKQF